MFELNNWISRDNFIKIDLMVIAKLQKKLKTI